MPSLRVERTRPPHVSIPHGRETAPFFSLWRPGTNGPPLNLSKVHQPACAGDHRVLALFAPASIQGLCVSTRCDRDGTSSMMVPCGGRPLISAAHLGRPMRILSRGGCDLQRRQDSELNARLYTFSNATLSLMVYFFSLLPAFFTTLAAYWLRPFFLVTCQCTYPMLMISCDPTIANDHSLQACVCISSSCLRSTRGRGFSADLRLFQGTMLTATRKPSDQHTAARCWRTPKPGGVKPWHVSDDSAP